MVFDDLDRVQGEIANGGFTIDLSPTITGKDANAAIRIYDNGVQIGEVKAYQDGNWTLMPSAGFTSDLHNLTVKAVNEAGVTSENSPVHTINIDTNAPTFGGGHDMLAML